MSKILIGLITHPKSKSNRENLNECIKYFSRNFNLSNWDVVISVCGENYYENQIKFPGVWLSYRSNINLMKKWLEYVENSYEKNRQNVVQCIINKVKYEIVPFKYILKTFFNPQFRKMEFEKYRRNLNISLAHLKIMRESLDKECDLTLILEDDAILNENEDALKDLIEFSTLRLATSDIPSLLTLSESLRQDKKFVNNQEGKLPKFKISQNIYFPKIMHHNTTCSVIYNKAYIWESFHSWKVKINKLTYRGIPIDWFINALVIDSPINSLLTFHSNHNLIIQGSLNKK